MDRSVTPFGRIARSSVARSTWRRERPTLRNSYIVGKVLVLVEYVFARGPVNPMTTNNSVKTLDAALHLLDAIALLEGATLTEIAAVVGMPTSKTHRLLVTLEANGYLTRGRGKTYALGPKVLFLGHRSARGQPLLRAAAPVLERLSSMSGETALLAIRFGLERLIVDSRDARFGPQAAWPHDARLPLHSGALGICLLAYAPSDVFEAVVAAGLSAFTASTVADADTLRAAVEVVRREGVLVSRDSFQEGMYSIASPVLGGRREAVAAVAVVGERARLGLEQKRERELADLVRQGASDVSRMLT